MHSSFIALAAVVCVLALACAIESWFGAQLTDGNLRSDLKPLLRGSGGFGEIMAMASILFAGFTLHINRRSRALACGVTAVLAWLGTIQSLERAPFIGASFGFSLLITGAVIAKLRRGRTFLRLSLLISAMALVLISQMVSLGAKSTPVHSTVARLNQNLVADNNARARFLFWGVGLEMLREHPLLGVGGNNYEAEYAEARAKFSVTHPNSPLIGMNEDLLTVYAHNEYIQQLAELGVIGFLLFLSAGTILVISFWRAMRRSRLTLPAFGAGGAMLAFAVSSSASGSSFRYFGGGLLFFFAAAIVVRIASLPHSATEKAEKLHQFSGNLYRSIVPCLFALTLLIVGALSAQAAGAVLAGLAQNSAESGTAESYYRTSLRVFPYSAATHFSYGIWLYNQRRSAESETHLTYALERGFNSSICYAYLAGAQDSAGNQAEAEQTFARAVHAYPVSVFLLVRHAIALEHLGRSEESRTEFSRALFLDAGSARGWQDLINNDIDAAYATSQQDKTIALPGQLVPQSAVFEVLQENEQRFPQAVHTGFRARMRAEQQLLTNGSGQVNK
ncbi:MAG: O-antigen ligase family protein [Acidobacteriota bacterium]